MTTPQIALPVVPTRERRLGRSILAVVAGFVAVFVLSVGADQLLHVLGVYPPRSQPMRDPKLFALATTYRVLFTILGGWITARLAPSAPQRHALILGGVGLLGAIAGLAAGIKHPELGPLWYPIALVVTAVPCTWLGGKLDTK